MTADLDLWRMILAWLLIATGGGFLVIGAIGIIRMPDVFTRLHAASVADTFGASLVLVGLMVVAGASLVTVKLLFLLAFLWFMGPVATHAIARAAMAAGVTPVLGPRPGVVAEPPAEGSPSRS